MEYDVFISYSRNDIKQIEKFVSKLEELGFRVWIDRKGIESGDSFKRLIVNAIENCSVFAFFNSANSVKSPWTTKELGVATACGKPIIPIKLDKVPYSKEDLFDLINLDFIDYSDPITRDSMMDKFIGVVISKCPERWQELQAIRAGGNPIINKLSKKRILTCILIPPLGLAHTYVAYKNNRKTKAKQELIYSSIGMIWVVLALTLLLIFRPFTTVKTKVTQSKQGEEWCFNVNGVPFTMKFVMGGAFEMGGDDPEADTDEQPIHKVTVNSYYMSETEVTKELWEAVMNNKRVWGKKRHFPLELENELAAANTFLSKLNQLTGLYFVLPTEAEWEYAARGGVKSKRYLYSGSNSIHDVAWFRENSQKNTHPVKEKLQNELGLYDMSGSVWELCTDCYGPYSQLSQTNPTGPQGQPSAERVVRGGSWSNRSYYCRVSYRNSVDIENDNNYHLGIRLVLKESAEKNNDEPAIAQPQIDTDTLKETLSFKVGEVSFDMKLVEGATFDMGGYSDADDAEPIHQVELTSYYIAETEVTQALWEAVMGTTVEEMMSKAKDNEQVGLKGVGPEYPMYYLNWYDCQEFVSSLDSITGKQFRLPTEAEWEFAARGGRTKGYRYSGGNTLDEVAWYKGNSKKTSHPVKQLLGNALGVYDMNGNVWEWCSDWYGSYEESYQRDPQGPENGDFHVVRGASWNSGPERHGVSARNNHKPDFRHVRFGLRLVLPIDSCN